MVSVVPVNAEHLNRALIFSQLKIRPVSCECNLKHGQTTELWMQFSLV